MRIADLVDDGDGYTVHYRWHRFKFLLDDGGTVEVTAIADGSELRDHVLKVVGAQRRIEGVATLGPVQRVGNPAESA